jgi:hypothetical protein
MGTDLIQTYVISKVMPHHSMDRLTQAIVGHHQPKYSVNALKQNWEIRFKGNQWRSTLTMHATSIVAEALEVLQQTGTVHTKLTPPVNDILMARRHQIIPPSVINRLLFRVIVDTLFPHRGVWLVDQRGRTHFVMGMLVENGKKRPEE